MKNLRLSEVSGLRGSARADYKNCDTRYKDTWTSPVYLLYRFSLRKSSVRETALFLLWFSSKIEILQGTSHPLSSFSHLLQVELV